MRCNRPRRAQFGRIVYRVRYRTHQSPGRQFRNYRSIRGRAPRIKHRTGARGAEKDTHAGIYQHFPRELHCSFLHRNRIPRAPGCREQEAELHQRQESNHCYQQYLQFQPPHHGWICIRDKQGGHNNDAEGVGYLLGAAPD